MKFERQNNIEWIQERLTAQIFYGDRFLKNVYKCVPRQMYNLSEEPLGTKMGPQDIFHSKDSVETQ